MMQPSQPSARDGACFLIGVTLLLSACASNPAAVAPSRTVAGEQVVLHEGEYKKVDVTGSNIRQLVSNSPTARPLLNASEIITLSPDEFRDLVRRGDAITSGRR